MDDKLTNAFGELVQVVSRLRRECPWDSVQTHESLKECMVNEIQEVLEGIDHLTREGDGANLCEELGDVLMLLILQSLIAGEEGAFTLEDVITGISSKMKYRHPRIFSPEDEERTSLSWEELKRREKAERRKKAAAGRPAEGLS